MLENAGPEDSGNYTCTGSNSLGTCTTSTSITVISGLHTTPLGIKPSNRPAINPCPEESGSVGRSWFMMFLYAVLVWLVVSCCVAGWMGYQWWHAERHKPSPVDRNGGSTTDRYRTLHAHPSTECFAIDHDGEMVPEPRPRSRLSREYTMFGGGYPNPAYSGPLQEGTSLYVTSPTYLLTITLCECVQ